MQGKALFGKYASDEKREIQFALAANQLHHFMPVRAATDGRFKYIRSYIPYRQFALRNYYQWGMPSNKAWDKLVLGGHNTNPNWAQTFNAHPAEMLFDLEKDPGELHNLSDSPEYEITDIHLIVGEKGMHNEITGMQNDDNHRGVNTNNLDLSYNHLEEFPGVIIKKGSPLGILILQANGMTTIKEGDLVGPNSHLLTSLDFQFNKLKEIPFEDFVPENMPYIGLSPF